MAMTAEQRRQAKCQQAAAWRDRHPARAKKVQADYRKNNSSRINARGRLRIAALKANNPKKLQADRRQANRRKAGIVGATGETRFGQCPICCRESNLVCDHDHKSGAIRGWICSQCNVGIGNLGDNPAWLRSAAEYLER